MNTHKIFRAIFLCVIVSWCAQLQAQCPSIDYLSRSSYAPYVNRGWDTVVNCKNPRIRLDASTFITTAQFDGTYTVESIPYNPPDTTFHSTAGGGSQLFANTDDIFAPSMRLPFKFAFFGVPCDSATVGANGVITFNNSLSGQFCPYNFYAQTPIPNASFPIKNAIYGVYEDINPQGGTSGVANQGIYEAIYDTFPCRKLCVSWNGIPVYGHSSQASTYYSTYQIVCYEGTNIIEVHVKKRKGGATANNGEGLIGIQNAAGTSAFTAPDRNPFYQDLDQPEAWRFTPNGITICNVNWYYGTDTSAATGIQVNNTDSTILYTNEYGSTYAIEVQPTVPTTYTMRMRYFSATGIFYDLTSEVTVGVDKDNEFSLETNSTTCCQGEGTQINIATPRNMATSPRYKTWICDDPRTRFNMLEDSMICNIQPFAWMPSEPKTRDTALLYCTVTFKNGCQNYDSLYIVHIRRADSTFTADICNGQEYTFEGQVFNHTGSFDVPAETAEGCDYTKTLRLNVHNTDFAIDEQKDCNPYTWIDGETYSESNNTATFTLANRYGCDSIINLNFYFDNSLQAIINVVPEAATLDLLHLQLKDMSLGSSRRMWHFPDGTTDTNKTTYYEFPPTEDSITIMMVAFNDYNCEDTAYVTIPLLKESIWFPNAFTPGRDVNSLFQIKGIGITSLSVDIFDRRGILINHFDGIDGSWDGTYDTGGDCPMGGYVYVATYTTILNPNNPETHKGAITLIR